MASDFRGRLSNTCFETQEKKREEEEESSLFVFGNNKKFHFMSHFKAKTDLEVFSWYFTFFFMNFRLEQNSWLNTKKWWRKEKKFSGNKLEVLCLDSGTFYLRSFEGTVSFSNSTIFFATKNKEMQVTLLFKSDFRTEVNSSERQIFVLRKKGVKTINEIYAHLSRMLTRSRDHPYFPPEDQSNDANPVWCVPRDPGSVDYTDFVLISLTLFWAFWYCNFCYFRSSF